MGRFQAEFGTLLGLSGSFEADGVQESSAFLLLCELFLESGGFSKGARWLLGLRAQGLRRAEPLQPCTPQGALTP